ncbi:MAG: TolB family protein, partial [Chloroflexota bacterium]
MLVSRRRIISSLVLLALSGSVAAPSGAAARSAPAPIVRQNANLSAAGQPLAISLAAQSPKPKVNTAALRGEGSLAFTWGASIYAASAAGGMHLITNAAGTDLAWSHDGHWLAYIQTNADPKVGATLWMAAAGGGKAHRVSELTNMGNFAWSPTGDTL